MAQTSDWYNLDLPSPKMKIPEDTRVMAKFTAALMEKFTDLYTYAGGGGSSISDFDGDTKVQTEESTDEDIIRFDTGDTQGGSAGERMTIDYLGAALATGLRVTLDGRGGNDYIKYNSVSDYMEFFIAGILRMEL